ncbi:MAG: hypothetical protein ACTHZ5_03840 [Micrococcaceae bacterium]
MPFTQPAFARAPRITRRSRRSGVALVSVTGFVLLALTGCGASDSTEETCERLDAYVDELEDLVPEDEENTDDMADSLREMTDGLQDIRDDASDEDLASSLDSLIDSYEVLYTAFDEADPEQSSEEILAGSFEDIDTEALGEAGVQLEETCQLNS